MLFLNKKNHNFKLKFQPATVAKKIQKSKNLNKNKDVLHSDFTEWTQGKIFNNYKYKINNYQCTLLKYFEMWKMLHRHIR